ARDKGGAVVAARFARWVAHRAPARPRFAIVDFADARSPYHQLPDAYLERFTGRSRRVLRNLSVAVDGGEAAAGADVVAAATAMYDAAIAYDDALLGRVIGALRARGVLDRTILVVVADHGELLGEHGAFGHGRSLYEPLLRVPLLIRY